MPKKKVTAAEGKFSNDFANTTITDGELLCKHSLFLRVTDNLCENTGNFCVLRAIFASG